MLINGQLGLHLVRYLFRGGDDGSRGLLDFHQYRLVAVVKLANFSLRPFDLHFARFEAG